MGVLYSIRKWNYNIMLSQILKSYDDSYKFFLIPQGLGDILFFCMYLKEYRKKNPTINIAIIVTKQVFLSLVKLFSKEIDVILVLDLSLVQGDSSNKFLRLYPQIYNPNFQQPNLRSAVRRAMGLTAESSYCIPNLPQLGETSKEKVHKILSSAQKIVLIAPDANSCPKRISDMEWIALGSYLSTHDFFVFFNTSDAKRFPGFHSVFLSLEETIDLCNKIPLFIGYRSGLCDVVATFCSCKQWIAYPNNLAVGEFNYIHDYDKNLDQAYMQFCSLKRMYPKKDIHEFIYSKDNFLKEFKEQISWLKF